MKTLCIRFDIDTPTCLREGVPRLLDLNERMGFRSTYFLSVGRAVSRRGALARMLSGSRARAARAAGLSSREKLGLRRYAELALLNPEIGRRAPDVVDRLARSSDLGLHGGRNHDLWQHHAHAWPRHRVGEEIDWALAWLAARGVSTPGFSSPGWNQPADLAGVLQERGFLYHADRYGAALEGGEAERPGFFNLATNLLGEPGGVAYLEHMRARGLSDAEIRDEFRRALRGLSREAVLYDHPYYVGLHALGLLEDLVQVAREEGWTLITLTDMARRLADGPAGDARIGGSAP